MAQEGALAFVAEVVMFSVVNHPCKASAMVYFPDIITACEAVVSLKKGPVDGAELLDRLSLRSVENKEGIPAFIKDFDDTITAVLLETLAPDMKKLDQNIVSVKKMLTNSQPIRPVESAGRPGGIQKTLEYPERGISCRRWYA